MTRRYTKFFIVAMILCVFITITAIVLNITNESNTESGSHILGLDEAIELMKEKFVKVFDCVEEKSCNLYVIDVGVIVTPVDDDLYSVSMFFEGSNYTRGSVYRDTIVWRAVLNKLSYHISMIDYGVSKGYEEWLDIEKRLGIHLNVGYGIYDGSRDALLIHIDLPTFKYCNHVCGQFYLNTTLCIDNKKYVVYQYTKLNFSYLVDRGYVKIREVENGYTYPINPPAILHFTYIRSPFWRIPIEFLEKNTSLPIVAVLHIATTNRSVLEKHLDKLEVFRPLIEASLMNSYVSEVAHNNLTKFVELLGQMHSRAIQEFLEYLRSKVVEKQHQDMQMVIKYVSNSRGGNYYLAKWNNTILKACIGTLDTYIHNAPQKLVEILIDPITNIIMDTH